MKARMPEGFNNKGSDMNSMVRQAQKMQEEMARIQAELDEQVYSITSGGGAVSVTITGKRVIQEIKINPEVVSSDDIEMLEDLLVAAVNEAVRKVDDTSAKEMEKATGGFKMPGLF